MNTDNLGLQKLYEYKSDRIDRNFVNPTLSRIDLIRQISSEYDLPIQKFTRSIWMEYVQLAEFTIESTFNAFVSMGYLGNNQSFQTDLLQFMAGWLSPSNSNEKLNALQKYLNQGKDKANKTKVVSLNGLSGYTCPAANICLGFADYNIEKDSTKFVSGKNAEFKCYSANGESRYPNVYAVNRINTFVIKILVKYDLLGQVLDMLFPVGTNWTIRIHSAGDFYNKTYFVQFSDWVASRSDIVAFGYTKVLPYVLASKPDNFHLVYSNGGIFDEKAQELKVQSSYVITSIEEKPDHISPDNWVIGCAHPTDPNDYNAILSGKSFGLMLH